MRLRDYIKRVFGHRKTINIPDTVIFRVHAGGLGDNLAYSILPRLYKYYGARKVFISSCTNVGEPFVRNSEIKELLWDLNPYLDGVTDEAPNVGEMGWPPVEYFRAAKATAAPVDTVSLVHRLPVRTDKGSRIFPAKPDVFYKPRYRGDFGDKVICDPRSISQGFSTEIFHEFASFVARWYQIDLDDMVVIESENAGPHGRDAFPSNPKYAIANIFEYSDIIASAKACLVTESGGQSLAAAFRERNTYVLMSARAFNERNFIWPTNLYMVSGQASPGPAEWA